MKKRILTGDRPTGPLHIGHLFGSLHNRVALQRDYDTFVIIADVQALTDNFKTPEKVRDNVREVLLDNLAVGVDPTQATFFIQSLIPEIAELTVYFSNLVTIARLQRNPTVKQEIKDKRAVFGDNVTFGFLGYPVSQAADISFLRAHTVPVGEDQLPVLEQTREILAKFNSLYGETFPLPEALVGTGRRILGIDGNAKMSKSLGNCIYLKDDDATIRAQIKRAKTDTDGRIVYDPATKPEVSNLLTIFSLASGHSIPELEQQFAGSGYGAFKEQLAEALIALIAPIRERRATLAARPTELDDILQTGITKTRSEAQATMQLVREHMHINYFDK